VRRNPGGSAGGYDGYVETYESLLRAAAARLQAAGIEDARLEAEVLLRHAAGIDRAHLLARLRDPAPSSLERRLRPLVQRRLAREPLAYVTGRREFFGLEMECSPGALVPRQETETLVELALHHARSLSASPLVLDVGTGSGAIAVALAVNLPSARVVAVDCAPAALQVARRNAERHGVVHRVRLVQADLLAPFNGRFDLIVANLPYVKERDWGQLAPEIRDFEPRSALVAGPRGTEIIERLLRQGPPRLNRPGALLAEIGWDQGARLRRVAEGAFPRATVEVRQDLAGLDRVLLVLVPA